MDQPGKVANPARGQLKRENKIFPVPVRAWESDLARRIRLSCPTSACSFSQLRLTLVLTQEIPPDFRGSGVIPECVRSRNWVPMALTAESPPAPIVLNVVPVTGPAFSGITMETIFVRLFLPTPTTRKLDICDRENIGRGQLLVLSTRKGTNTGGGQSPSPRPRALVQRSRAAGARQKRRSLLKTKKATTISLKYVFIVFVSY